MDANRITRFTVAGWAFVLAWPLQLWIFGYDFNPILNEISKLQSLPAAIGAFLVGMAAGPVLGFFLSSISFATLRCLRGGEPEFEVPIGEEFKRYSDTLKILLPREQLDELLAHIAGNNVKGSRRQNRTRKRNIDLLIPYFNLLFHSRAPSGLIEYSTRRWTLYWMSANSICSIILGSIFGLLLAGDFYNHSFAPFLDLRYIVEFLLVLFVILGYRRMKRIPQEIHRIAWMWLYNMANHSRRKGIPFASCIKMMRSNVL